MLAAPSICIFLSKLNRRNDNMYKEIEFSEDQIGFGLVFTNPNSGIRGLAGIFDTYEEAYQTGVERSKQVTVIRPEVVPWDREHYDKYAWVFNK
jgi:hypothetical protein